ncbi:MAG TPA: translesion DNA synthesis-associated protein ImuA [Gammaproteobacteria bacterium]|nr:translesion DNA synthesis-associated protein ImuA [Gammaproteobacteria bacterium]
MAAASLTELLSRYPTRIWTGRQAKPAQSPIPTAYRDLDAALGGGWPVATLVEILSTGQGMGECSLLLPALAACTRAGKTVAWLPEGSEPYAPALLQAGLELHRLLVIDTGDSRERLWAAEQCLRSGVCAVVLVATSRTLGDTLLRRLKLAAAGGDAVTFLLRPESAAHTPSPAALRIRVRGEPGSNRRCISILKHSAHPPRTLTLDLSTHGH